MASNQMSRGDKATGEREARLPEKDRVPKMASHFDHLAEKVAESATAGAHHHHGGGDGGHFESLSDMGDKKRGETVTLAKFEVTVDAGAVPGGQGQGQAQRHHDQQKQQQSGGIGQGTRLSSQGQQDQNFLQGTRLPAQGKQEQNFGQGTRLSEKDQNFVVRGHGAPTDQHDLGMSRLAKESHAGQGQQFGSLAKGTMSHGAQGQQDRGTVSLGAQGNQGQAHKLVAHVKDNVSYGAQGQQFSSHGHGPMSTTLSHGAQANQQGQGQHFGGQGQQFGGQTKDTMSHGGQGQQFGGQTKDTMSHGGQGQKFGIHGHGAQEQEHKRDDWEKHSGDEIGKHRATQQTDTTMPPLTTVENLYAKAKQPQEHDTNKSLQEKNQSQTGMTKQSQEQRPLEEEEEEDMEDAMEELEMEGKEGFALKDKVVSAAAPVKDTVVNAAQKTKETVVPVAKTAVEYAGKAKDTAVVAGWSTAQLTAAAAVEGTKLAARAVQGVAGYVAPVVGTVGHKGAEIASRSFYTATDAALSTGETAKEYAARKKEEARREMEAKRLEQGEEGEFEMETPENEEWEAQYAILGQGRERGIQGGSEWEAQPQRGAKDYAGLGQQRGGSEWKPQQGAMEGQYRGGSDQWKAQQGAEDHAGFGQGLHKEGSEWETQRGAKDCTGPEGLHRRGPGQGPPRGGLGESKWETQQGAKDYASPEIRHRRGPGEDSPMEGLRGSEWEAQRGGAKDYAGPGQGLPGGGLDGSEWESQRGAKNYAGPHEGLRRRGPAQGPLGGGLGGSEWEAQQGAKNYAGLGQMGGGVEGGSEWEARRAPNQHREGRGVQGGSGWEAHQKAIDSGWEAQQGVKDSKDSSWEVVEPTVGEQAEEITGGVLHAIGETIVEIAQTTKNLVIGHDDPNEEERFGSKDSAAERFKTETGEAREQYAKNIQDRQNVSGSQY